jgi:hypothetical protein
LAALGIQGDSPPGLVRFHLHQAGHFIRCALKALSQHILLTGDGWDMQRSGQCLNARDEKAQSPRECDTHRVPNAAQRNPVHQQAFNQRSCVIREEILLKALDELASAVVALMMWLTVVNVPICLILG